MACPGLFLPEERMNDKPTTPSRKGAETARRYDAATARLFRHDNNAAAMEKEARRHRRLKARKDWKAANP